MDHRDTLSDVRRRQILVRSLGLAGACVVGITIARNAVAGKSSKTEMLYQDHPHEGKHCGDCKFFSVDGGGAATGTCSIVEGTVSRDGWCMAFAPRS